MSNAHNLFGTLKEFDLGDGRRGRLYSVPQLEKAGLGQISRLPVSMRIVLESVLRNCDGKRVSEANVRALAGRGSGLRCNPEPALSDENAVLVSIAEALFVWLSGRIQGAAGS